jgi:hypothetical protein
MNTGALPSRVGTAGTNRTSGETVKGVEDPMETFCYMMVEEFLMRKKMTDTLSQFRNEWIRPDEEAATFSWYEVCMKLRLPDILDSAPSKSTVLENVATTLIKESSLRMRAPMDVVVKGLAKMPKPKPLPGTKAALEMLKTLERESTARSSTVDDDGVDGTIIHSVSSPGSDTVEWQKREKLIKNKKPILIPSRLEDQSKRDQGNIFLPKSNKPSAENWVPEITRMKSIGRDLSVAQDNLGDIIKREAQNEREMRQFKTSIFEKAKVEESLGTKKKIECACCKLMFSYVNLPLKVSNKAVVDNRRKWANGKKGWWSMKDEKLAIMPRCYVEVHVCTFCAQFFFDQDAYRPSLEKIEYEARRTAFLATKQLEKERWDPVKLVEKDRAAAELAAEMAEKASTYSDDASQNNSIGSSISRER